MNKQQQQEAAAQRVAHLLPERITCRYCGESSASGSFKGFAHKYGPRLHWFFARRPTESIEKATP